MKIFYLIAMPTLIVITALIIKILLKYTTTKKPAELITSELEGAPASALQPQVDIEPAELITNELERAPASALNPQVDIEPAELITSKLERAPASALQPQASIKEELIKHGIISKEEYSNLEGEASRSPTAYMPKINEPVLRDLLFNKKITPRQAIYMDYKQIRALNNPDIMQRFINGTYRLEFLGVPCAQSLYDTQPNTRTTLITWARSSYFTMSEGGLNLINVQGLLEHGYISLERLSRLRYPEIHALNYNYNRIVSGEITINRLLAGNDGFNTAQSTHTASVHKSVSESATKLSKEYKINNIRKELTVIQNRVEKEGNAIHKRCIKRITAPDYVFRDRSSELSFQQALCFAYKALNDCTASEPEMFKHFLKALYEIQRCYNLDSKGNETDINAPDSVMCVSGSFNKIISFLWGFHPLVEIIYISKANATTKLQAVVEQALQNNPGKPYEEIRPQIEKAMQEYRSAFSRETEFQEFIDAGEYIEPKKQLTNSN